MDHRDAVMEDYIKLYYNLRQGRKSAVLENSDRDLGLDETFAALDYSSTVIGRQYLYDRLKSPLNSYEALAELEHQIQLSAANNQFLISFEQQAKTLARPDSGDLPYLIFGGDLKTVWYYRWVPYLQVVMAVVLTLSFFLHWGVLALIALFGFHLYLHFHNKVLLDSYRRSLDTVITLHDFWGVMKKQDNTAVLSDQQARQAYESLKPLRKRLSINQSLQLFTSSELYMLPWLIYELIKAFLLVEVRASAFIIKEVNLKKSLIHQLYKAVGKADFLFSIIKLREAGGCCIPAFVADIKSSKITGLYHPLIENCVKNDFSPLSNAVLITGSNAAGKSTFLRSLSLNNILAASIHTCFAESFELPLLLSLAAMRHSDDLNEGLSHYLSEVKDMAEIFKASAERHCLLLFDEPFNGTNSRERIAIAASVLRYFAKQPGHLILVASHDFELLQLLEGIYKMYYFNEQVNPDGKLSFDYRLKEGKKVTRNALELIKIEGFPAVVVEMANEIYQQMEGAVDKE